MPLTVALWAEQVATEHVMALGNAALVLQRIACLGGGVGVLPKPAAARAAFEAFYVIGSPFWRRDARREVAMLVKQVEFAHSALMCCARCVSLAVGAPRTRMWIIVFLARF